MVGEHSSTAELLQTAVSSFITGFIKITSEKVNAQH